MPPQDPDRDELLAEIGVLRRHLAELQHEKADLELLIETTTEHSDFVAEDLWQTLDATKTHLLSKITKLNQEVAHLRQKISELQQEKVDLELVLDMNTQLSGLIEEDLLNKVEVTLRESKRRFRLISETIPVPITISRLSDQIIVYANEPASNFFGLSVEP
jgi:PAS domain-containing protein